jgi:hypothetical protein
MEDSSKGWKSLLRLVFGFGSANNGILFLLVLLLEFLKLVTTGDADCAGTSIG